MKPHSVAVHPSPTLRAAVGWRSPVTASFRVEGDGDARASRVRQRRDLVARAAPRRDAAAAGQRASRRAARRSRSARSRTSPVQPGDLVSLLIGPRDGNHSCDLTAVDLTLTSTGDGRRPGTSPATSRPTCWPAIRTPTASATPGVWHFYTEPDKGGATGPVIPAGSLLAQWQAARDAGREAAAGRRRPEAADVGPPAAKDSPDAALYRQLASLGGPLFGAMLRADGGRTKPRERTPSPRIATTAGLGPRSRAVRQASRAARRIDAASLCVQAPSVDRDSPARRPGRRAASSSTTGAARHGDRRRGERAAAGGRGKPAEPDCPSEPVTRRRPVDVDNRIARSERRQRRRGSGSRRRSTTSAACSPRRSATPRSCRSTRSSR